MQLPGASCSAGTVCLHRLVPCSFLLQGEVSSPFAMGGNICVQLPCGGGCCVGKPLPTSEPCLRQSCWVPHMWKTYHTMLCLYLGVGNLPGGTPGTVTLSHLWPASTSPRRRGGSALPWAQRWGAKAMWAGPPVTNCSYSYFCSTRKCVQKSFEGEYVGVFS